MQIDTFGNILYVHAGQDSPTSDSYVIDICASFGSKEAKKKSTATSDMCNIQLKHFLHEFKRYRLGV